MSASVDPHEARAHKPNHCEALVKAHVQDRRKNQTQPATIMHVICMHVPIAIVQCHARALPG